MITMEWQAMGVVTLIFVVGIVVAGYYLWKTSRDNADHEADFWHLVAVALVGFAVLGGELVGQLNLHQSDILRAEVADRAAGRQAESALQANKRAARESLQVEIGRQESLRGIGLQEQDLHEFYFAGKDLSGANLSGTNLHRANLERARLTGANLRGAVLTQADLAAARMNDVDLDNADLAGADLRGANLRFASLIGANLSGADLFGADLTGAILMDARLDEANLTDAQIQQVDFLGADLSSARLFGAYYDFLTRWPSELSEEPCSDVQQAPCRIEGPSLLPQFVATIRGVVPDGWLTTSLERRFSLVAPNRRANILGVARPCQVTLSTFLKVVSKDLPSLTAYQQLYLQPAAVPGGGTIYERRFNWLAGSEEVTQQQLYYVEAGRCYVVTATAQGRDFLTFEDAFRASLENLIGLLAWPSKPLSA